MRTERRAVPKPVLAPLGGWPTYSSDGGQS
jgi:hypothetical protein